ncbi:hypothetical protein DFH09DRAFT_1090182 [Mycena vulgaris]|nr:hypothetical protein DFH09DRAFT_1090182 [Mycena vulgaris]
MHEAKNTYLGAIHREKRAHWRLYVTELPRCNIWKAAKYALDPMSSPSTSRIPDLVEPNGNVVSTPAQKAAIFHHKFFPPEPPIPPSPPTAFPAPLPTPSFSVEHVLRAIAQISPWKAPGPSGIPNVAISSARQVVTPALFNILEAGMRIG